MKRKALMAAVVLVFGWSVLGDAMAAGPQVMNVDVDVGSGASISMPMGSGGMGGSFMTGGGPALHNGQQFGTMMHSTMTSTMAGMMGQTFQHRIMSFEIQGQGTVFATMAGGSPWTGAKGIIMGGTDKLQGIAGTVTVGDQVGPTRYMFNITFSLP